MVVSLFNWIDYPLQYLSADTTPLDFTCYSNLNKTVPRGQTQVFVSWQIPTATDERVCSLQEHMILRMWPRIQVKMNGLASSQLLYSNVNILKHLYALGGIPFIHGNLQVFCFFSSFICFTFHIIDKIRTVFGLQLLHFSNH